MYSREEMDALIAAGRATRWTRALAPDNLVPVAAWMDDTWYVVLEGPEDRYQPASEHLAAVLTAAEQHLNRADESAHRVAARAS